MKSAVADWQVDMDNMAEVMAEKVRCSFIRSFVKKKKKKKKNPLF
jgi:hypothetical protein